MLYESLHPHSSSSQRTRRFGGLSALLLALLPLSMSAQADTTAPTVASMELDLATATATTARMIVTFSEPVTGVDATDFVLNGTPNAAGTITGVTPGATAAVYNVAFSYTGTSGSLQMAIKTTATGIADVAGNAFVGRGVTASAPVSVNAAPPADMTPPTVTSFAVASGAIASPASLTLVFNETVTGVSADDFVTSSGATIGAVTGSGTTWTIPVSFTGTAPVTVTVIGGASSDIRDAATHWFAGGSAAATATFTPGTTGGTAPAITSPLTATIAAGANFTYTIAATNTPTTFTATGLPAGLTFTSPTISGSVTTPGTYSITIGASNAAGSATQELVLTVTSTSTGGAPAITSPLTASVTAGTPFSYAIAATNSPTSYSVTGLPAGLTFASPIISGTVATPGTYQIAMTATNAAGSAHETLALTVTTATGGGGGEDDDDGKDGDGHGKDKGDGPVTVLKLKGEAITLPSTTADGKPITWILVSGNATLVGNVLTPKNHGSVVVRAFVAGSLKPVAHFDVKNEDPKDKGKPKGPHHDRLSNLSSRLLISAKDSNRAAIIGFVVDGVTAKQVLVRAVGPGLAAFNLSNTAGNVRLQLFDHLGVIIAQNDGWKADAAISAVASRVGAFPLNGNSHDSALLVTLAPGSYTALVDADRDGIALIEVYDATSATTDSTEELINLSTRGHVGTGDENLVAGFIVTGDAPKRVLVRGAGPALAGFGLATALGDPTIEIYNSGGSTVLARNDNWETPQSSQPTGNAATAAEIAAAAKAAGAFPFAAGSKDAAVVVTLMPGAYTAVVKGANGTTGTGLVEVYEVPDL